MGLTHDDALTRVWAPATTELGWVMEHPCASMNLARFSLHSLRDRYSNTALHSWNSTEVMLLGRGSWKDPEVWGRLQSGSVRVEP